MRVSRQPFAIAFACCLFLCQSLAAQQRCGMDQLIADRAQRFPEYGPTKAASEAAYQQFIAEGRGGGNNERVIPVVVHIIQQTEAILISDARVQSQIDVLNEDFLKLNADTSLIPLEHQAAAANTKVRFCLATIDPNGCPTTGINRVVDPVLAMHNSADEAQLKALAQWDPHRYLNMWVPVTIVDDLLGYATFPDWLPWNPAFDGVVINGTAFGRGYGTPAGQYNLGRTATHEVGHWVGLYHTFQNGCAGGSAQNCNSQGDLVCDTPPTANPNFGCPGLQNTCTEFPADLHDQTMNYMDYGDDACLYMYTAGQKARMDYYFSNERAFIWTDSNLTLTGCNGTQSPGCQPVAAVSLSIPAPCSGQAVQFTDLTSGGATTWDWTFPSGNPATSTLPNPVVTWTQPGTYTVTLIASNGIGIDTAHTIVTVAPATPAPLIESFEATTLPSGWYETSQSGNWVWAPFGGAASNGSRCMVAQNYHQPVAGLHLDLYSEPFDMSDTNTSALLTFDHAYKRRGGFAIDSLHVWASSDCGATWQRIWNRQGPQLATVAGFMASAPFVPTVTQWKSDSVDLSAYLGQPSVRLRFRAVGGASQDIYLDNINLPVLVGLPDPTLPIMSVSAWPNPSSGAPSIQVGGGAGGTYAVRVIDLQGRELGEWMWSGGRKTMAMPESIWGSMTPGLYVLEVRRGVQIAYCRLVKAEAARP